MGFPEGLGDFIFVTKKILRKKIVAWNFYFCRHWRPTFSQIVSGPSLWSEVISFAVSPDRAHKYMMRLLIFISRPLAVKNLFYFWLSPKKLSHRIVRNIQYILLNHCKSHEFLQRSPLSSLIAFWKYRKSRLGVLQLRNSCSECHLKGKVFFMFFTLPNGTYQNLKSVGNILCQLRTDCELLLLLLKYFNK